MKTKLRLASSTGDPNPLMKRIPRELRKDLGKYIALFLFMTMMIGLVSGFIVADGSMLKAYNESFDKYSIEDGHFNCDQKLTNRAVANIEKEGVDVYEIFYKDKPAQVSGEEKTVRIYRIRDQINLADVMEGRLPGRSGEIVIDRLFAENNAIHIGDKLTIDGHDLSVTGLVALGDYSALFKNNSDMMFNASAFTVSMVSDEQFSEFDNSGLVYSYAWRYKDQGLTDEQKKDKAEELMSVVYENSMLGSDTSIGPMLWNMFMSSDAFSDGDEDLMETDAPLDEYVPRDENQAIKFTGRDMGGDKTMFEWFLYIVTFVLAFAFAVTTRSTIEQESKTIGTLRASGYTRQELLVHYCLPPVIITFTAALAGNILGYTVLKNYMASMYYHSYSLPSYVTIWSGEAFVKTTLIPCLLVIVVEMILIGRTLSLSPLAFLRRDLKRKKQSRAIKLPDFSFPMRYRLRIMLQNRGTYLVLFTGIFLSSVIFLFGSLFLPLLDHFKATIQESEFCKYQYILKEEAETDIPGAEQYAVTTLENERGEPITIYGIQKNSAYLDTSKMSGLDGNDVLLSSSYFDKYLVEPGDMITFGEEFTSDKYDLKAKDVYEYPASLAVFMTIDQFREVFDLKDNYYSGYLSNEELTDIPDSNIATTITEEDLLTTANQLEDSMSGAFRLFLIFSIIMFIIMIYLLAKLVTDRNGYSISMLKILGYSDREAGRFYNSATGVVVVLSLIISGFLGLGSLKVIYHVMMRSFTGWMTFYAAPWGIPVLIATGIACYFIVSLVLMRRIRRIPMTNALKDADL